MEHFWGWVILACFFVPVLGGVFLQVIVSAIAILGPFTGMGTNSSGGERIMKVRVRDYDMDEDY
jgi:hypothetical protein